MLNSFSKIARIAVIAGFLTLAAKAADVSNEFVSIFNGKDLTGWDGDPKFWSVKDGAITGQSTAENPVKQNTFCIWRGGQVDDFELRLKFKLVGNNPEKWANSGIQYRSKDKGNWSVSGYQSDMEGGPTYTGILYEEGGRGILALRGTKVHIDPTGKLETTGSLGSAEELQKVIHMEDWNEYVIIAKGNHLLHRINGKDVVEVTDDQESKRAMSGILGLQMHAGKPMTVQFKEIELKKLK